MNTYRIEMYKSKSIHRFCNVVAETAATAEMVAHYYNLGYWTVRSRLLYEGGTVDLCAREIGQDFPG
jgi:hypothetical protein